MTTNDCCSPQPNMVMALIENTISEYTFLNCVFQYFYDPTQPIQHIPPPKIFPAEDIWRQINRLPYNCDECVMVEGADDHDKNSDITFTVTAMYTDTITRYYDMTFFNALFNIVNVYWPIETFGFTKACLPPGEQGASGSYDIIFQTNFVDKTMAPLYWDLSSSIPPIK